MKNITKMRIIHTEEYNAEAEYLKTFFEFIGILVYDEVIYSNDTIYTHLKKENDKEGVDIVLNYYSKEYSINYLQNRLYLYFDLQENICKLENEPLESPFLNDTSNNPSRKDTRINALNNLINEIWKDDEENLQAILKIKELYVSKTEDNDLFYILQAIYCTNQLFSLDFIKIANMQEEKEAKDKGKPTPSCTKYCFNISLDDDYIKKMFFELWRIICNLKDSDNPYITYTTINAYKLLLILYSYLYNRHKYDLPKLIEYNNQKIELKDISFLYNLTKDLLHQHYWFTKAYFMLIELNEMVDEPDDNIFMHLINESKTKKFPAYYSSIYHQYGLKQIYYATINLIEENYSYKKYINKGNVMLDEALQIDQLNFRILYDQAFFLVPDRKFESAKYKLANVQYYIGNKKIDDMIFNFNTMQNNILVLETYILLFKIALNTNQEYSMRNFVGMALRTTIYIESSPLINVIADENEGTYNDFIEYMKYSTTIWNLYSYLEPIINYMINNNCAKKTLKKQLSRWDKEQE